MFRLLAPPLLIATLVAPVFAEDAEFAAELNRIDTDLSEVEATLEDHPGGLIHGLAAARREALLLARRLIENRQLAEAGAATLDLSAPATRPDPDLAARILEDMAATQRRIDAALAEAAAASGVLQATALVRVETERLSLAQLQMAYLQASYGIAIPLPDAAPEAPADAGQAARSTKAGAAATTSQVATPAAITWADARFTDVDYSLAPFELAHRNGHRISGWWTIEEGRAPVDDSVQITAINYSAYEPRSFSGLTALVARCTEGETALIYVQPDYLVPDLSRNSFAMTLRIDDQAARADRWSALTTNKGAGLFGTPAEDMMRALIDADRVFLRLTEKNGRHHDALFDLAGQRDAFEAVAGACGWTTLSLSSDDTRAIQELLAEAGFDPGPTDGQWGPGSRRAMRAFQAEHALPETGQPDRESLGKLGFDP
ncbi:peptidoglycan-binding protein [Roseovarius sp. SCSIO 43702]|uniref:peptidoglycan-binding protein n=1 Tax=Roseovarius sp. SCSIO 43702 TaxID=2823043 RepID=UPI002175CCB5|nr:peptidoglycan-binding protein [Roseovarius sp. SCSIO 43702]